MPLFLSNQATEAAWHPTQVTSSPALFQRTAK